MLTLIGALLLGVVLLLFTIWTRRTYSYWKRRGVFQLNPIPIIGDVIDVLLLKQSLGQFYQNLYNEHKNKKYLGFYELVRPTLLVTDPVLIENILVKDFSYFVNRDIPQPNLHKSEVDSGLPQLKDSVWRGVRYKLIPAFSSGKLKLMYQYMRNCAQGIIDNLESQPQDKADIKEITTMYALDAIGSCAFGIDVRNDVNKNSKFRTMGKQILHLNTFGYYCFLLINMSVKLAEMLGLTLTSGKVGRYFAQMIKDTIKLREESKVKRNDFIDLLLQLRDKGVIEVQSKDPEDSYLKLDYVPSSDTFEITEPILISQAFTFLTAGFDGLSGPMACIMYELAKQPHLQDKARNEIQEQISKYGDLTYDALKNSKYLDCCINEGLRIYPLTSFLLRVSNKEYEIEPGVKIEAGTKIIICMGASQVDPDYYANPLHFDPSRFDSEITSNVTDFSYLPFGAGPRMCIGMRFAQLVMKLGLATLLLNYNVRLTENSPNCLKMKIKTFFINQPEDPIQFNVKKIK